MNGNGASGKTLLNQKIEDALVVVAHARLRATIGLTSRSFASQSIRPSVSAESALGGITLQLTKGRISLAAS